MGNHWELSLNVERKIIKITDTAKSFHAPAAEHKGRYTGCSAFRCKEHTGEQKLDNQNIRRHLAGKLLVLDDAGDAQAHGICGIDDQKNGYVVFQHSRPTDQALRGKFVAISPNAHRKNSGTEQHSGMHTGATG